MTTQLQYEQPPQNTATKGLAIAALITGIAAFLLGLAPVVGILAGIAAVTLGIMALVKKQPKGFALTGIILGALGLISSFAVTLGLAAFTANVIEEIDAPKSSEVIEETTEPTEEPAQPPVEEDQEPDVPTLTDTERGAILEQHLKESFGVTEFIEVYTSDPSLWAGYIANIRVEGPRAYITLQVSRDTPDGRDLGERAAQALSTLISKDTIETINIDWIIVEDGAGVVIDQKQPNPLS